MPSDCTPQLREQIENTIRFLAVDAVERAGCGHPGAPMGLAAAAFELFDRHMRFDPSDPDWPLRDRFVLSGGHASMLLYSMLHLYGYDVSLDDLRNFRQLGSKTPGHPEYGDTPGVEVTTGPLGQGFAHAVGMALAGRMTRSQLGGPADADAVGPGNHFVYGFMGDGDMMEGISSEAASFAGHLGLGNLVFIYDDNSITIDGGTEISFSEDIRARFESHGWHVQGRIDGQDTAGLDAALEAARAETERPSLIILQTVIGRGSPNVAGKSKAHGAALGADEVALTKEAMGWPAEPTFLVPDAVRSYFDARCEEKKAERRALDALHQAWREAQPDRAAAWDAARNRKLPGNLAEILAAGRADVVDATRKHSAVALQTLADCVPFMVGGSADLAGSAAPPILKGTGAVGDPGAADRFAGRNIHFGVREHAMAAITNGIALDGTFIAYSGTFLIFSDYMRPAIRLAALMKIRSFFVFTHDSFFVGEDGPTHQPVEQLDSLRAIPGLTVLRPADGIETALAYAWILEKAEGPALLSLTRQTGGCARTAGGLRARRRLEGRVRVVGSGWPDGRRIARERLRSRAGPGHRRPALEVRRGGARRVHSEPRAVPRPTRRVPVFGAPGRRDAHRGHRSRQRRILSPLRRPQRAHLRDDGLRGLGAVRQAGRALRLHGGPGDEARPRPPRAGLSPADVTRCGLLRAYRVRPPANR